MKPFLHTLLGDAGNIFGNPLWSFPVLEEMANFVVGFFDLTMDEIREIIKNPTAISHYSDYYWNDMSEIKPIHRFAVYFVFVTFLYHYI